MQFDEYQKQARETARYSRDDKNFNYPVTYPALGLVGEAGEVAEKVKKVYRDDAGIVSEEKKQEIAKELGDVLWYIAQLATELELSLEEIAQTNIEKLALRRERGKISGSGDDR